MVQDQEFLTAVCQILVRITEHVLPWETPIVALVRLVSVELTVNLVLGILQ